MLEFSNKYFTKEVTDLKDFNKHLSPDLETEKVIQLLFMKRDNAKNPHPISSKF
ncbi:hypothetical protein ACR77J_01410 [Tissierella praeacuta]|uniref:hypothetical protein n=1 Tax=Tissierella praeacuta TaxID=43131 RepID=UPI003DA23144